MATGHDDPVSEEAKPFYKDGQSGLQNFVAIAKLGGKTGLGSSAISVY